MFPRKRKKKTKNRARFRQQSRLIPAVDRSERCREERGKSRRDLLDACVIAPVSSGRRRNIRVARKRKGQRGGVRQSDGERARKGSGGQAKWERQRFGVYKKHKIKFRSPRARNIRALVYSGREGTRGSLQWRLAVR